MKREKKRTYRDVEKKLVKNYSSFELNLIELKLQTSEGNRNGSSYERSDQAFGAKNLTRFPIPSSGILSFRLPSLAKQFP